VPETGEQEALMTLLRYWKISLRSPISRAIEEKPIDVKPNRIMTNRLTFFPIVITPRDVSEPVALGEEKLRATNRLRVMKSSKPSIGFLATERQVRKILWQLSFMKTMIY
jgi:hypothetical protein